MPRRTYSPGFVKINSRWGAVINHELCNWNSPHIWSVFLCWGSHTRSKNSNYVVMTLLLQVDRELKLPGGKFNSATQVRLWTTVVNTRTVWAERAENDCCLVCFITNDMRNVNVFETTLSKFHHYVWEFFNGIWKKKVKVLAIFYKIH